MATEVTLTSYIHNPWDGTVFNTDQLKFDYSNLGFTPSASDSYKSTSGDIFKVYVDGVRIYRNSDSTYATGTGFLEDGDISNSKLNGLTSIDGANVTWASTSDTVWYIDTANQLIYVDQSAITATVLYGEDGKDVSFTSGTTIVELKRGVNDESGPSVDFSNASILTEQDLDNSSKNVFHMAQQAVVTAENALPYSVGTNTYQAYQPGTTTNRRITQVAAPTANDDAVTKTYMENTWLTATDKTNSATVAGISSEVATVAGDTTEVTTLVNGTDGTTGTGGTTKNIALVNTVATNIASVNTVATDIVKVVKVADDLLETVSEIETVAADLQEATSEIDTVSNSIANVDLVGTNIASVTTVAGQITPTNNVATVAGKATEIGLLGTSAMGHATTGHLALLGTSAITNTTNGYLKVLGNTTVTDDMALLAVPAVITDMDLLGATGVIADMDAIGATGVIGDIETVADNLTNVNNFADRYQIDDFSPTPTTDGGGNALTEGDLAFDTTANQMKVWDGSAFGVMGLTQANATTTANNAAVAMAIALG